MKNEDKKTVLVLRTCAADMSSHGGFEWPGVGETAIASDWSPRQVCGYGLHGWLYGQGDHECSSYLDETAKWLVVEVEESSIVMLGGKCKFPCGVVRFVGSKKDATDFLIANEPRAANVAVIGATASKGDGESALVGALGTATAGDRGTAAAGYRGTAAAGYSGTATAGALGTATAGALGTATAGYSGTATAGYSGTATAGDRGTATAGDRGTAAAGEYGVICIRYWDNKAERYRIKVGNIGEEGLLPNVAYRLDNNNKFVPV